MESAVTGVTTATVAPPRRGFQEATAEAAHLCLGVAVGVHGVHAVQLPRVGGHGIGAGVGPDGGCQPGAPHQQPLLQRLLWHRAAVNTCTAAHRSHAEWRAMNGVVPGDSMRRRSSHWVMRLHVTPGPCAATRSGGPHRHSDSDWCRQVKRGDKQQ